MVSAAFGPRHDVVYGHVSEGERDLAARAYAFLSSEQGVLMGAVVGWLSLVGAARVVSSDCGLTRGRLAGLLAL